MSEETQEEVINLQDNLPYLKNHLELFKNHHVTNTELFDALSTVYHSIKEREKVNALKFVLVMHRLKELSNPLEKINQKYSKGKVTEAQRDERIKNLLAKKPLEDSMKGLCIACILILIGIIVGIINIVIFWP